MGYTAGRVLFEGNWREHRAKYRFECGRVLRSGQAFRVTRLVRNLNRPSLTSHLPGGHLNRPDARRVIPLAAHPGILLFLASSPFCLEYGASPAHRPDEAQRFLCPVDQAHLLCPTLMSL
jgi:hypothetical protein